MVKCDKCENDTTDFVPCSSCKRNYDYVCAGISEKTYRSKGADYKKQWKCPHYCRRPTPSSTPTEEKQNIELNNNPSLTDVMVLLKDLKNSVDFQSAKHDDFMGELRKIKKENDIRDKEIKSLKDENRFLHNELKKIKEDVAGLNQQTKEKSIEIHGIEEEREEKLESVVNDLAQKLKLPTNYDTIYRTKNQNKNKIAPIVVKFTTKESTTQWLKQRKTGVTIKNNNIYINENLTPENRQLFYNARKNSKETGYRFCWVKNGKIFIRKDENSVTIHIKDMSELQKYCKN